MCDEFNMCEMEENEFDIDILKDGGEAGGLVC